MIEWIPWLRARSKSRTTSADNSVEHIQFKFYGGGDVNPTILIEKGTEFHRVIKDQLRFDGGGDVEHHLPTVLTEIDAELNAVVKNERIIVQAKRGTQVIYRQPGSGKLIAVDKATKATEIICVSNEEDLVAPPSESLPQPPLNAEYILHLFLKSDERDAVIGDLLERYAGKHERFGEKRAKWWFYGEVVRSLWPLLKRVLAKASGVIALGEWIRRHVS